MEHWKMLNLQTILNLWQENETLSMINEMQIMTQKFLVCDYNNTYILVRGNLLL